MSDMAIYRQAAVVFRDDHKDRLGFILVVVGAPSANNGGACLGLFALVFSLALWACSTLVGISDDRPFGPKKILNRGSPESMS